ncbi:MAG: hypothetical protein M1823_002701 [Watsoniomyces obsoletus]|nr:MAG: hypothetical protein M1823_002701 [Watsoniomyces obsoletus]
MESKSDQNGALNGNGMTPHESDLHPSGEEDNGAARQDAPPLPNGGQAPNGQPIERTTYRHLATVHSIPRTSCLSHDSTVSPSFLGFRNLMVIMLVVSNLRLMIENYMKYGVLICIRCHDYRRQDFLLGALLYLLIPCHLFLAYLIELMAAQEVHQHIGRQKKDEGSAKRKNRSSQWSWRFIGLAHAINATICLGFTSIVVYSIIHHPMIGTLCEFHAVIVWLKICSYALTNRDLRRACLDGGDLAALPAVYSADPYPHNITLANLSYFWWAPTLVYQPRYPRSPAIRWGFLAKRVAEMAGLCMFIWIASSQYASPLLRNSLDKVQALAFTSIVERVMKLSTISLVVWLAGFFALFHSYLNALAEIMRFGDREFYTEWWNSPSVGTYWRTWNKPVYYFMRRHVYSPLVGRGWSSRMASAMVFLVSAILHEMLVGLPTHNVIGVAFAGMMLQLPLSSLTAPLETMRGVNGKVIGNVLFWVSFCLVGQPLAILLYFFAWQAKYGSVSKSHRSTM